MKTYNIRIKHKFTAVPYIFEIVIFVLLFELALIVFFKLPISGFSFSLSWIIVVRILVNMPVPERLAYGQSQMLSHNI